MKVTAAVLNKAGSLFSLEELDIEEPRPLEVRVRMVATGLCYTDITTMSRPFPIDQPIVLGHEGAGIVESVGSAVTRVKPGDRVVASFNYCGQCGPCKAHAHSYCADFIARNSLGQREDGTTALSRQGDPVRHNYFGQSSFSTFSICHERNLVKVPDSVSPELFEMLGPLGCGIQTGAGAMINVLRPGVGGSVAVFGSGGVGMAAIMAARSIGVTTVIAIDRMTERLELAKEVGATHVIATEEGVDLVKAIKDITGVGVDVSLDTTGDSLIMRQAVEALAPLGRCGLAASGATLELDVRDLFLQGKTVRGIVEGDSNAETFIPELIKMHQQGVLPFDKLVKFYPFEQINQAVADVRSGATVKPVIRFPR